MLLLDVIIRYPAITLMLMVAVLAWRDGRHDQSEHANDKERITAVVGTWVKPASRSADLIKA